MIIDIESIIEKRLKWLEQIAQITEALPTEASTGYTLSVRKELEHHLKLPEILRSKEYHQISFD
jgi:hypothetical protein